MWRWILLLTFPTSLNLPQRYSTYYRYLLVYLTLPISARDSRYQSAFCIQEQPQVYLPWFSWIRDGRREATAGSPVVYGDESKVEGSGRSTACYLVSFAISAYTLATDGQFCGERFCFVLNNARPLLPLETAFFEKARAGKGSITPSFKFQFSILHFTVPVIAIFTKFDDLMTQIYDMDKDDDVNRQNAEEQVEKRFRNPLYEYAFPPRADVCFEGKYRSIFCQV